MADKRKRFVIIDGKSVFYRGYYAMPNLRTKEGVPTGGVYGFAFAFFSDPTHGRIFIEQLKGFQ